jgi:2-dehydropantoate 2-reductase
VRIVVYGAGAIGGVVGGLLHRAGHEVVLIARGAHFEAIADGGLRLETPEGAESLRVPVVDDPAKAQWERRAVVLLGMKSQHTEEALQHLAAVAPRDTPVVCMQNGVENERRVLRLFAHTYGLVVMSPTSHLAPGVVQAHSAPITGLLDVGRYPSGVDETATELAGALRSATFRSEALIDVMRWKYGKLITNLSNAVTALCGPGSAGSELVRHAREEGEGVLEAAGIDFATPEEEAARNGGDVKVLPTASGPWRGGSSWQSAARRTGSIESDFLSGEIVLLGRLRGVSTPVNELLQRETDRMAALRLPPGTADANELLARALSVTASET